MITKKLKNTILYLIYFTFISSILMLNVNTNTNTNTNTNVSEAVKHTEYKIQ